MTITQQFVACTAATLIIFTSTTLPAGEITNVNWFSGVASVAGTVFLPPSAPNNDNVVGGSPNDIFVTQKDYFAIGPVDLVFDVINTGGVTEYAVVEGVQNNTGVDWTSYHVELGFGNGAGFVKSLADDGLDFDAPDFDSDFFFDPSPGFFPLPTVTEDDIFASGGVMPFPSFAGNFVFHVDVPDGITSFTIRQSPIPIPEPSTSALATFGLLGLGFYGWRRRRRAAQNDHQFGTRFSAPSAVPRNTVLPRNLGHMNRRKPLCRSVNELLSPHRCRRSIAASTFFTLTLAILAAGLAVSRVDAFVLDMEGFAPPGDSTSELDYDPPNYGVSTQGSFSLTVAHGHYYSATHSNTWATSDIGGTASDWFLHDSDLPLRIEELGGNPFSVTSFQAGEWRGPFAGNPTQVSTTGNPIEVTGFLDGGGTITTTFVSDNIPSDGFGSNVDFEMFFFGPGWTNLIALEFLVVPPNDDDRQFGYDNIVIDVVPEPSTFIMAVLGLLSLGFFARRRRRT